SQPSLISNDGGPCKDRRVAAAVRQPKASDDAWPWTSALPYGVARLRLGWWTPIARNESYLSEGDGAVTRLQRCNGNRVTSCSNHLSHIGAQGDRIALCCEARSPLHD